MKLSMRAAVFVGAVALLTAPLSATVYTISLNNGTTFETRYEPRDAYWDSSMITFEDEVGNIVALAKSDVVKVESDVAAKGYGKMLDDTTMAFGWAPNDLDEKTASAEPASSDEAPASDEMETYEPGETPSMPLYISVPNASGEGGDTGAAEAPANTTPPPGSEPAADMTDTGDTGDTGDSGGDTEPPPSY